MSENERIAPQPPPVANDKPAVWLLVIDEARRTVSAPGLVDRVVSDMEARHLAGIERYGVPLQPHNGRDALVDAYQEALDLSVYLRQDIIERGETWERREDYNGAMRLVFRLRFRLWERDGL